MRQDLKHVLCIDDDDNILEIVALCLETVGSQKVTLCASGHDGIEMARRVKPDLILLDVMMPGMDGLNTLAGFKECPDLVGIPIVFMTARTQPAEIEDYLKTGAAGVVSKPFNPMTLFSDIHKIWMEWHGKNA